MIGLTREIFQLGSRNFDQILTSALPDGDPQPQLGDANLESLGSERLPILSVLGWQLPPETTMQALLEDYFVSVHWFSLVILEPKFRAQFDSIRGGYASPDQKPFLVLLSLVLALSSWYCSKRPSPGSEEPGVHWAEWASTLIRSVESLMFEIMDGNTVEHIQTFILLGSFHCYHGKPKAAFSLLGAAIKTAQAISLHREPIRGTVNDVEERKRIWWTIYTWDRWSSITYGRPFGIDDRDCTISMPRDFYENRRFASEADEEDLVCYSAYQRELNKLYVTASPMLKSIFSARSSAPRNGGRRISQAWNLNLMNQTHHKLKHWKAALPGHLVLDVGQDISLHSSAAVRAHRLQALSLQLTFDHLIIFFHRSLLAKQLRIMSQPEAPESTVLASHSSPSFLSDTSRPDSQTAGPTPSSPEEWWEAALRTSRVTQLPHTAQLATDGHLVAFLGINLLNAAIVLVICALTDPLTDRAQEAKRNITRVARMQEVLGKRSQLALQSSAVLRSMIYMIVQKEAEAMLASVESTKDPGSGDEPTNTVQTHNQPSYSVEDALRLPLTAPGDGMNYAGLNSTSFLENDADEGRRLNESLATVQRCKIPSISGETGFFAGYY